LTAPLAGVLPDGQVATMRKRLAGLLMAEGAQAGIEVHQEAGTDRLADLGDKDPVFRVCFTDPRVLACIAYVLGGFKLSSLNLRAALPGRGHQALHTDRGRPVTPGEYQVCNSIWLLDDFTADNGATPVIPGSHRLGVRPREAMLDPAAAHPGEVQLIAPAGTVVISTATSGTAARATAPASRAAHCIPISPAAATRSSSTRGSTSVRKHSRA
jgi:ectoine hydroxylase-related dioxygenase (phytanoyl-CoA dioxygenase family)